MYFGKSESSILQLLKIIISAFLNQKISKSVNAAMNILLKFYSESNDRCIRRLTQKPEIRKLNKLNKLKKNTESCTTTYMIRKNDRSYSFTHGLGVCNADETHCFNAYDACTCLKRQMKEQRQNEKKGCLENLESFNDKIEEVKGISNSQKEESIYDRIENHFSKLRSTKEAEDHKKINQNFIEIIDVRCDQNERDSTRKKAACIHTHVYNEQSRHSTVNNEKIENLILKLNRICRLINYLNASLQNIKSIVIKIIKIIEIISKEMQICKASCGI